MSAFNKNNIALLCAVTLSLSTLAGCGSGGVGGRVSVPSASSAATGSRSKGRVQFTLTWPQRQEPAGSRYIPVYANSLRFVLVNAADPKVKYTIVVPRPADVSQPQIVAFPDPILTGSYHLTGTAHSSQAATDAPVATAAQDIQVSVNATTNANLTLVSTVSAISILGQPVTIGLGVPVALQAQATAADGTTLFIPTGTGALQWTIVSGAQATQATLTAAGVLTANMSGTVRVRVAEVAANIFAEADVTVAAASSSTNGGLMPFAFAKFGGDLRNSGSAYSPVRPFDGVEAFHFSDSGFAQNSAALVLAGADNAAYVAGVRNGTGRLYARNSDGSERWSIDTVFPITGSMALSADNTLYAPTGDFSDTTNRRLLAFRTADGSSRWSTTLDFAVASGLTIAPNGLVIAAGDTITATSFGSGLIAAYDGTTGTQKWLRNLNDTVNQLPALSPDGAIIYDSTTFGTVYALDANTGARLWVQFLGGLTSQAPIVGADGTLFITQTAPSQNGKPGPTTLYALDGASGVTRWTRILGNTTQPVVSSNNRIFIDAQPQGADTSTPYSLLALDGASGATVWETTNFYANSLVLGGGGSTIYAHALGYGISAVDAGTGNIVSSTSPDINVPNVTLSLAPNGTIYGVNIGGTYGDSLIAIH
jgi:outer membrane protein assembly factor BamB